MLGILYYFVQLTERIDSFVFTVRSYVSNLTLVRHQENLYLQIK